jgi:hypothetical protein
VVELVDTLDLGSSALTGVGVRVPPLVHSYPNYPVFYLLNPQNKAEHT